MPVNQSNRLILHVDDDPAMLRLMEHLLTQKGYTFEGLTDPRAALDRLQTSDTSVVLLDVNMPHVSGVDLLREVKSYGGYLPVIMLTGIVNQFTLTDAINAGAEYCLFKPIVQPEKLYEVLELTFRKIHLWRESMIELRERRASCKFNPQFT